MKSIKKAILIITILVLIIGAGIFALYSTIRKSTSVYNNFDFSSLDLSKVADGTYTGSEDGNLVKAMVEVTVKDHVITEINILSHDNGKGKPAEIIIDDIIENNSLSVDAISGATYSSNVIKVAVYNALTK